MSDVKAINMVVAHGSRLDGLDKIEYVGHIVGKSIDLSGGCGMDIE